MSEALVLHGTVVDDIQEELRELRAENLQLRRELQKARQDAAQAHAEAGRALGALRKQLSPLYRALQQVFGELEDVAMDEGPTSPRVSAVWENWKTKMPGYPARIIDALLLHRDMNTSQLAIAVGCHKQRISEGIVKLNKAGLIDKNGGRFSLKDIG